MIWENHFFNYGYCVWHVKVQQNTIICKSSINWRIGWWRLAKCTHITNGWGGKGPQEIGQFSPCPQSRISYSRLLRTKFSQAMSISKDREFTSLENLQCLVILTGKKMGFKCNSLNFILWPLYLVLPLNSTEKNLAPPSSHPPELLTHICKISAKGWTVPSLYSLHFRFLLPLCSFPP